MNKIRIIARIAFIAILIAGCTSTRAFSVADRNIQNTADIFKVALIESNLAVNEQAQTMERVIAEELRKYGVIGYSHTDLFPPIRKYTREDRQDLLDEYDISLFVFAFLEDSSAYYYVGDDHNNITEGFAIYKIEFYIPNADDPFFLTEVTASGDLLSHWNQLHSAAARRAVSEYATYAGLK